MSTSGQTTHWNANQYLGDLFLIGANSRRTPFLNMAGGIDGRNAKITRSWQYPVAQTYDLDAPAQPAISETHAANGATANTYTRTQDTNTCQIFQEFYDVTYPAQSDYATLSGLALAGGEVDVKDELGFQRESHLLQMVQDMDKTFLEGSYVAATNASVAAKTRGIVTAISTNTGNASSAQFSKSLLNALLVTMFGNGSPMTEPVIFCGGHVKTKISDVYGYAPTNRNVGGVDINQVETDFGLLGVSLCPNLTTSTLLVADMAAVSPVFLPCKGELVLDERLSQVGAAEKWMLYSQAGIAYGPEEYHGKITSLATS